MRWILYQSLKVYIDHKQEFEKEPAKLPVSGFFLESYLLSRHDFVVSDISDCETDIPARSYLINAYTEDRCANVSSADVS